MKKQECDESSQLGVDVARYRVLMMRGEVEVEVLAKQFFSLEMALPTKESCNLRVNVTLNHKFVQSYVILSMKLREYSENGKDLLNFSNTTISVHVPG